MVYNIGEQPQRKGQPFRDAARVSGALALTLALTPLTRSQGNVRLKSSERLAFEKRLLSYYSEVGTENKILDLLKKGPKTREAIYAEFGINGALSKPVQDSTLISEQLRKVAFVDERLDYLVRKGIIMQVRDYEEPRWTARAYWLVEQSPTAFPSPSSEVYDISPEILLHLALHAKNEKAKLAAAHAIARNPASSSLDLVQVLETMQMYQRPIQNAVGRAGRQLSRPGRKQNRALRRLVRRIQRRRQLRRERRMKKSEKQNRALRRLLRRISRRIQRRRQLRRERRIKRRMQRKMMNTDHIYRDMVIKDLTKKLEEIGFSLRILEQIYNNPNSSEETKTAIQEIMPQVRQLEQDTLDALNQFLKQRENDPHYAVLHGEPAHPDYYHEGIARPGEENQLSEVAPEPGPPTDPQA